MTPNIFIFLKTPKTIEIQISEPKMTPAYVCMKISEYPPRPPWEPTALKFLKIIESHVRINHSVKRTPDTVF